MPEKPLIIFYYHYHIWSKLYVFDLDFFLNFFKYSPFHKTLPKSSLKMHWISVRFYEIGDISAFIL